MNEIINKYKEKWHQLAVREKVGVAVSSVAILMFAFYQGFWSPMLESVNNMRTNISSQEKLLAWMQSADVALNQAADSQHTVKLESPMSLLTLLQKKLNQANLTIAQLKQSGNDSVQLELQKVNFDKFIVILTKILSEQQVSVTQLSVTAQNAPGVVDVNLILKLAK